MLSLYENHIGHTSIGGVHLAKGFAIKNVKDE